MPPSLDDTDLRILLALQADPRVPVSKIARQVGLTDNAVRYRVRRMQQGGIIRGFSVILDPRMLGRPRLGIVCIRMSEPADLPALVQAVPEVAGAYQCKGPYNACLFVCLREPDDFERVVAALRKRPGVTEVVALQVVESHRNAPMPLLPPPLGMEGPELNEGPPPAEP